MYQSGAQTGAEANSICPDGIKRLQDSCQNHPETYGLTRNLRKTVRGVSGLFPSAHSETSRALFGLTNSPKSDCIWFKIKKEKNQIK